MLTLNPFLFYLLYVTFVDTLCSQSVTFYKRHNKVTLTVAAKAIQLKPEGIQVVEGVGLVASGFFEILVPMQPFFYLKNLCFLEEWE